MKSTYKVSVEFNMNASNVKSIKVRASNEKNAAKLAKKKAEKMGAFFTQIMGITRLDE